MIYLIMSTEVFGNVSVIGYVLAEEIAKAKVDSLQRHCSENGRYIFEYVKTEKLE